jgi:hypothetical protein
MTWLHGRPASKARSSRAIGDGDRRPADRDAGVAEIARLAPQDRIGETTGAVLTASYAGLLAAPALVSILDGTARPASGRPSSPWHASRCAAHWR